MACDWTILHGGALGDLALSVQLALRLPGVGPGSTFTLLSRVRLDALHDARPSIRWRCPETAHLHWLFSDADQNASSRLTNAVRGGFVLSMLGDTISTPHDQLLKLNPRKLYSVDPRPRPAARLHITEQWARALYEQGALLTACRYQTRSRTTLGLPPALYDAPTRCDVLLQPGSGGAAKCWPLQNYLALAELLRGAGVRVAFAVGPVELESWPQSRLALLRSHSNLFELPDSARLIDALATTHLLISNDAGHAHLASLLATPTLTIFGPTDPAVWRPLGTMAQVVRGEPAQSTSWGLDPADVANRALEWLGRVPAAQR